MMSPNDHLIRKNQPQKGRSLLVLLLGLFILGMLSLFIFGMVSLFDKPLNTKEFMVVWGKLSNENDPCIVLILDPDQQEIKTPIIGEPSCNYGQTYTQGSSHLVHVQEDPGIIKIYDVTSKGQLDVRQTILFDEVKITSFPQWGDNKYFYISGILDSKEQIFRVDSESGEFSPFIYSEDDVITLPTISTDGKFLKYVSLEGKNNSFECRLDCYNYFSLLNIDTGESKELSTILEPVLSNPTFTHCRELWSPNGKYLAFNVGCGSEFPQEVVIVDVHNHHIANVISPSVQGSGVDPISWLSDTELLVGKSVEESQSFPYRYFVHSVNTDTSQELQLFDGEGSVTRIFNIDVANDGSGIVGTSVGSTSDGQTQSIVIGEIVENNSQLQSELGDRYNNYPLWSSNNDWIAVAFAKSNFGFYEDGASVGILDKAGKVILETKDIVFSERSLGYGWFESN